MCIASAPSHWIDSGYSFSEEEGSTRERLIQEAFDKGNGTMSWETFEELRAERSEKTKWMKSRAPGEVCYNGAWMSLREFKKLLGG